MATTTNNDEILISVNKSVLSTLETITFPMIYDDMTCLPNDIFDHIKNNDNLKKLEFMSYVPMYIQNDKDMSRVQFPSNLEILDLRSLKVNCLTIDIDNETNKKIITAKIRLSEKIKKLTISTAHQLKHMIVPKNVNMLTIIYNDDDYNNCNYNNVNNDKIILPENLQILDISKITKISFTIPESINTLYCRIHLLREIITNNIQKLYVNGSDELLKFDFSPFIKLQEIHIINFDRHNKNDLLKIKVPYNCSIHFD